MFPPSDYTHLKDYELNRLPAAVAKAEEHRQLEEAGLVRRPWLSCQICRSLVRLGHVLVKAGRRLESRYGPLTPSQI